jgi:hypothetical protein
MAAVAVQQESTTVDDRDKAIRRSVLAKIQTKHYDRLDIRPVGPNKFRVNVWAEQPRGPEEFMARKSIVETFYHKE